MNYPEYRCHKVVRAFKIGEIAGLGDVFLFPVDEKLDSVMVDSKWVKEKKAEVGGYFVVYEDEYTSYSPAKAFEEGYALVGEEDTGEKEEGIGEKEKALKEEFDFLDPLS